MYDKKDLELFGLNESFTRQELEHEYVMILKRAKLDPTLDISEANAAYNRILGIPDPIKVTPKEQERRNKKMKFSENMIFFIAGGLVLLILAIAIPSAILRKSIDLHVCISGRFSVTDTELIKQKIRPDVKSRKTSIEFIYASFGTGDDSASYYVEALALSLLAGDYDLMVTDTPVLRFLTAKSDDILVIDMSEYLKDLGLEYNDDRLVKSGSKVYAIRIASSEVLEDILKYEEYYYLSIPTRVDDLDNALDTIKIILQK